MERLERVPVLVILRHLVRKVFESPKWRRDAVVRSCSGDVGQGWRLGLRTSWGKVNVDDNATVAVDNWIEVDW